MKRADWTLLAVAAAKGEPVSPVQLQKSLFVFGRECPEAVENEYYNFTPYNYGPFDSTVYFDAEYLAGEGYLVASRPPGQRWTDYAATPRGLERAQKLMTKHPDASFLAEVVAWARSLSFQQLVREIYEKYPDTRVNSIFNG